MRMVLYAEKEMERIGRNFAARARETEEQRDVNKDGD